MVLLSLQQLTDEVIEVSTNKTLNLYDIHTVQKCTNNNKISIVIPPDTINAVFPYTEIKVLLTGNGDVEIVNGDNAQVTVSKLGVSADIHTLTGKGTLHILIRESANKWIIISDQAGSGDAIASHNTSGTAHSDIRTSISNHTGNTSNPHLTTAAQVGAVPLTDKGAPNGVATLGSDGKVPSAQLPSGSSSYSGQKTPVFSSNEPALINRNDVVWSELNSNGIAIYSFFWIWDNANPRWISPRINFRVGLPNLDAQDSPLTSQYNIEIQKIYYSFYPMNGSISKILINDVAAFDVPQINQYTFGTGSINLAYAISFGATNLNLKQWDVNNNRISAFGGYIVEYIAIRN